MKAHFGFAGWGMGGGVPSEHAFKADARRAWPDLASHRCLRHSGAAAASLRRNPESAFALPAHRADSGSPRCDVRNDADIFAGCFRVPSPGSRVPVLRKGFTLLEVLAAIALLAIAFAIGLSALGAAARNANQSVALDTAVERAQSLLAEQGLAAPLKDETLSGKFDDGMAWTLKIHTLPQPTHPRNVAADSFNVAPDNGVMLAQASAIALYQLDVSVQYGDRRDLRLSTQRAQAVK